MTSACSPAESSDSEAQHSWDGTRCTLCGGTQCDHCTGTGICPECSGEPFRPSLVDQYGPPERFCGDCDEDHPGRCHHCDGSGIATAVSGTHPSES